MLLCKHWGDSAGTGELRLTPAHLVAHEHGSFRLVSRRSLLSRHLHPDPGGHVLGLSRRRGEGQDRLPLAAAHLGYRPPGHHSLFRPARSRDEALT